jgi:Domain of unknown function (DUF4260)
MAHMETSQITGAVFGAPRTILRLEAAAVLAFAITAYAFTGASWWLFAALFLVPDLSMLGYLSGPRIGAAMYNAGHSYIGPAMIGAIGYWGNTPIPIALALIWIAHIGFDRSIGYGLKYATAFKHTHFGIPRW